MYSHSEQAGCMLFSSRICVKNLPKYVEEEKLREFFSQKGEITDAKIMRTRDGKSRQFAFIGFRTEQEAEEAIRYFNRSYLDTSRITCEIARKVGDPDIPRPWSKHSLRKDKLPSEKFGDKMGTKAGTSTLKSPNTSPAVGAASKGNADNDPHLQEFLSVMQSRSKSKFWANDTTVTSSVGLRNGSDGSDMEKKEGDALLENGNMNKRKNTSTEMADKSNQHDSENQHKSKVEDMSDMDYFRSKIRKDFLDAESEGQSHIMGNQEILKVVNADYVSKIDKAEDDKGNQQTRQDAKFAFDDHNEDIAHNEVNSSIIKSECELAIDSGRLFVRNLPYTSNENELRDLFSKFGEVDDVRLVVDKDTKRSKGIGYVLYKLPESAVRALEELDKSIFQGRLLHVMPAKQQSSAADHDLVSDRNMKSFKKKREEQKKASEISGDSKSWNSLFMRSDTVVENMARKYGVSKSKLLDRDADDLAVQIALGETQVIADTKKALSSAGVNVLALEKYSLKQMENYKRSGEVILVKNLPFHSSEGDLVTMFGKYGTLDKVIMPPTKALALVVFLEPVEARAAFKGLAYKRYKDTPLYLEWAPFDILSPKILESDEQTHFKGGRDIKRILDQTSDGVPDIDLDPDRTESRSLFIKNLNFKTSDEALRKHFSDIITKGEIHSAKINKHVKNGKKVSMGYGFVEFDSVETATEACRDLQGTILDGHALILQLCHAKKDGSSKTKVDKDKSSTKLLVRNVAFEATKKDLRQLFSSFGQIKSIRLPMKFGSHRGFAFVEYITEKEAQNALKALSNTHLYGRHLVLEQAKEGESLEELRARTALHFLEGTEGIQKKKRKLIDIADDAKHRFENII